MKTGSPAMVVESSWILTISAVAISFYLETEG
jgi:hypothetical protein